MNNVNKCFVYLLSNEIFFKLVFKKARLFRVSALTLSQSILLMEDSITNFPNLPSMQCQFTGHTLKVTVLPTAAGNVFPFFYFFLIFYGRTETFLSWL